MSSPISRTPEGLVVFEVSDDYRYVLMITVALVFNYFMCVLIGGSGRGSTFGEEWMKENFGAEHTKALGEDIKKGGYPDCGSGRYIMKAGYDKWLDFNAN